MPHCCSSPPPAWPNKLKVWRLPETQIAGRGKAMVNLLPLSEGERITTILPLPEDETNGKSSMSSSPPNRAMCGATNFPTSSTSTGSGKIAMKLEAGDGIVGVQVCTDRDDVMLSTRLGKCIRFPP